MAEEEAAAPERQPRQRQKLTARARTTQARGSQGADLEGHLWRATESPDCCLRPVFSRFLLAVGPVFPGGVPTHKQPRLKREWGAGS